MRLADGALGTAIGDAVAPFGLNLIGVAAPAAYDVLVPAPYRLTGAATSVVVVGNGGGAFWAAFRAWAEPQPGFDVRPHPLDAFTRTVLELYALPVLAAYGVAGTLRFPFDAAEPALSFVHLAEAAGLGRRGLLGILIHPEFGPWMALRGALLLDVVIAAARPADGFDPCPACVERPCLAACPVGAVSVAAGWDVERCVAHRLETPGNCDEVCAARGACVYGRPHRYPADATGYHQRRAREVMERVRATRAAVTSDRA